MYLYSYSRITCRITSNILFIIQYKQINNMTLHQKLHFVIWCDVQDNNLCSSNKYTHIPHSIQELLSKKRIDIHANIIHIHYIWKDMNFNEITRIIIYRHFPHTHHSHEGNSIIQYFTSHFNQKQTTNILLKLWKLFVVIKI